MAKWKILYIDDSEAELSAVASALGRSGHRVTTRTGPYELDQAIADADLVIIDYHLGGLVGTEMLAILKEKFAAANRRPQFFLYTSDSNAGAEYRELGFDGRFILKGNVEALQKQVEAAIRVSQLRELRPKG